MKQLTFSHVQTVVIVVDYGFVNGGNGQVGLSTALALAHAGVETILFAAVGPVGAELRDVENLRVVCLDQFDFLSDPLKARGALRGLWNFTAAEALQEVLRKCDPAHTIVHVHSWTKALSSSVVLAAKRAGFSLVATLHDYFAFCPNGSLYDHEKQAPCLLRPMSVGCMTANCDPRSRAQKAYRVARQLVTDRIAGIPRDVRYFITVSPYSRDIAREHLGDGRIFDVPNPIDARREAPAEPGANDTFLYVGRLSHEKGTDTFAMAASLAEVKSSFVGDGPLGTMMRRIAPDAEFTGWLGREGVRERLRAARALVLPSRWYEASPLVVPEAAALGIPAIVADGCAAKLSIVNGVSGLTFRSGDVVDLAEKLKILSNSALAAVMGKAAYDNFWRDPPLMRRHIDALSDVYETILAEREA
jgi:glycosyltransferase involved in cell wall biosynthesis